MSDCLPKMEALKDICPYLFPKVARSTADKNRLSALHIFGNSHEYAIPDHLGRFRPLSNLKFFRI